MKRVAVVFILLCAFSPLVTAADRDVDAVVNAMEEQYGLHHQNVPWIARAFMKPALWGSGASLSIKLFENQHLPESASLQTLDELIGKALDPSWRPFVRVNSRKDRERTVIYAKGEGKHMLMMIVSAERDETTVLKMKLDTSEARKWVDEPQARRARKDKENGPGSVRQRGAE